MMRIDTATNMTVSVEDRILAIEKKLYEDLGNRPAYDSAILEFTKLIKDEPFNQLIYKHRGHRYLSVSNFDFAEADFTMCLRLFDKHWQAWHYLGLISYYRGDFDAAAAFYDGAWKAAVPNAIYRSCLAYWQYLSLWRGGKGDSPKARALLDTIDKDTENVVEAYKDQILLFKGELTVDDILGKMKLAEEEKNVPALGYGVAMYYYQRGDVKAAKEFLEKLVHEADAWYAVAYIASQVDLKRL